MTTQLKRAAELLRREAQILRESNPDTLERLGRGGEWNGNLAAKQDHDELLDAAEIVDKAIERLAELEATITPEFIAEKMLFELGEARKRVEKAIIENPKTGEVKEVVRQRDSVIEQLIKSVEYSFRLGDLCRGQGARIAELEHQAAIGRRAVLGLHALEWSRPVIDRNGFLGRGCIECGRGRESGHTEKCAVAAILRDAEQAGMGVE